MRRALLAACAALIAAACSCSDDAGATEATLEEDVVVVQTILGADPASTILHDVDEAVRAERPVMAAELIREAALPAVQRHVEELQRAQLRTREGRRFRDRAVRLLRARRDALERYASALARGIGTEDEQLAQGLHDYSHAELEISRLHDDLDAIRPVPPELIERARAEREAALGGLPPLRRDESPTDDEGEPETPEGGPDERLGAGTEPLPETARDEEALGLDPSPAAPPGETSAADREHERDQERPAP